MPTKLYSEKPQEVDAGEPPAIARLWPTLINAASLCAQPPATPPELMQGLLYEGGTMMLSGASKGRKTWTMLAAGIAVAAGRGWLGFQTAAAPVLYLNLELQDFAVAQRVQRIAQAAGIKPPEGLHLANLRNRLVTIDAVEKNIPSLIAQTGAKLVIVDPHYKLSSASSVEENSNDGQALLLYRIESAICSTGAAVMLAHHFAKGDSSAKKSIDRGAGGGALARWPDVVMTMTEHEEEECVTAEFALRNFSPVDPFVLRWQHPIWTRDDTLNPTKLKKAGRNNEHPAPELLRQLTDGMTNIEWRRASGWSDGTFRRKRDELIQSRKVRLTSGCYYHTAPESPLSPQSNLAS